MPNQIDGKIKEERSHNLIELSNKNEKIFLDRHIGKTVEVLFEQQEGEYIKGHTSNYVIVKIKEKNIENKMLEIKIIKEDKLELIGEKMK